MEAARVEHLDGEQRAEFYKRLNAPLRSVDPLARLLGVA